MNTTLTHRRHSDSLATQWVMLFGDDDSNSHYGDHVWTLRSELPGVDDALVAFAANYYAVDLYEARGLVDPQDIVDSAGAWDDPDFVSAAWERFEAPGYTTQDGAVVLDREAVELSYHYDA